MAEPLRVTSLEDAVDALLARVDGALQIGAPLGLGKPHRLLNALYARVAADPSRNMTLYTALSLDTPGGGSELERRFVGPFAARHFGSDFPKLAYVQALRRDALPAHVRIEEFYMQSGAMLGSTQAQTRYASLNYTHVPRALADRGVNCIVQKVASNADGTQLSLSSNTDLTFDAVDAIVARGLPRPLLVAEVDPRLPWLGGTACVDAGYFDVVITPPGPYPELFGLPRQPVSDADYAIGLYASVLVRDGGTLQIGIGALADALCHALALRHLDNALYLRVLQALDPQLLRHPAVIASGGTGVFAQGLYGCSEMINEGFKRLVEVGVMRRRVVDDAALMQRIADGVASSEDLATVDAGGEFLHGAFYLGSPVFYDWLRGLDDRTRAGIGMKRVTEVNELYGGNETLERIQRRESRFFNSCMMATALGAAVSDGLEDGRVVSGVGGQYNFVAMAHALPDARSVLMLRSTRGKDRDATGNVRWNYGHTTIPRHLRDVYITEHGIADIRGLCDEDCVVAMAGISDARFQAGLLDVAKASRKLSAGFTAPVAWARNTPQDLQQRLAAFRSDGTLPDYPLGSDFTAVEQRLVKALSWLQERTATRLEAVSTVLSAFVTPAKRSGDAGQDTEAMQRMGLDAPRGLLHRVYARLMQVALAATRS